MKLELIVAAVLSTAPVMTSAQVPPPKAAQATTKAVVERMKTNVAKIAEPSEKDRWQANLELWQLETALTGAATTADLDRMKPLVDRIAANVAKITQPAEKERWQANLDLWTIASRSAAKVPNDDRAKLTAAFERMKANVAKIADPAEKDRWEANRELWRTQLTKLGATTN